MTKTTVIKTELSMDVLEQGIEALTRALENVSTRHDLDVPQVCTIILYTCGLTTGIAGMWDDPKEIAAAHPNLRTLADGIKEGIAMLNERCAQHIH